MEGTTNSSHHGEGPQKAPDPNKKKEPPRCPTNYATTGPATTTVISTARLYCCTTNELVNFAMGSVYGIIWKGHPIQAIIGVPQEGPRPQNKRHPDARPIHATTGPATTTVQQRAM